MKTRKTWAIGAAVGVLAIVVALWAMFGRGDDPSSNDDAQATASGKSSEGGGKRGAKSDSTAKLLGSDKATISGTVRDEQGSGVAGARVCAWSDQDELRGAGDERPRCATSERDGHYRIEGLWPVTTTVGASAREFVPSRWSERVDGKLRYELRLAPGQQRGEVDLVLARGGVAVRGVVKDISGGVIPGAQVSGTMSEGFFMGGGARAVAWTDDEGRFELWTGPGELWLHAVAEGYAKANTRSHAPSERAEIFMTPESTITGVVVHAQTGAPVAGATVHIEGSSFFNRSRGTVLSDEDGRFRADGLPPGIYDVSATTDELYGEAAEQVHLGLSGQALTSVRMHPAVALRGRVVIAETGEPCPEGSVKLDGDDFDKYGEIEEQGTVLIRAVLPGEYRVSISCEGFIPEDPYPAITIVDQSLDELEWKVHTGLAIRGEVVDHSGRGLERINVFARPKPKPGDDPRGQRTSSWGAQTETGGAFELGGLIAGGYQIDVYAEGYPSLPEPLTVELDADDVEGVTISLPATGRLEGIVRDDVGQPLAGVTVRTAKLDAWNRDSTRTGDDGRFAFEHLSLGEHRVTAEIGWFSQMRAPGTSDDDVQGELVVIREDNTAEVALVVERRAGIIRGRVLDSDGAPIADAFIDAERMSDSAAASSSWARSSMRWGWDRQPVLTEHDGSFTLRELSDGQYLIRAYREGGGEALLEGVAVGTTDAVLTIVETGRITGKVTLAGGGVPERFTVRASERSNGIDRTEQPFRTDGRFALRDLPPGKYQLTVTASGGSAVIEVELEPGQAVEDLKIELAAKITVRGRLIDADTREPVPGFRVTVQQSGVYSFFGDETAGERREVSDASGRFEVADASTGLVGLMIMARDVSDSNKYGWTTRSIRLPAEPAVQDIGDIELTASRVEPNERPGDTGFKSKPNPPDIEPEDAVIEVAVVRPGGPAEAAGLAVGDRILEVDGRTVSGLDSHRYGKLVRASPGTVIELKLEGGKDVKIELGPPLEW